MLYGLPFASCARVWIVGIDLYPLLRHYDVWGVIVGANWNTNAMAVWRTERKELDSQSPAAAEEDKTRGNCC